MTNHRRLLAGVSGAVCTALFFLLFFMSSSGGGEEPPTTTLPPVPPVGECAKDVFYFRHALASNDNRFGEGFDWPAWQADPNNDLNKDGVVDAKDVQIDLHNTRCVDPARTVAHVEYSQRSFSSAEERLRRTEELVNNRQAWRFAIVGLEAREATAVKVEVVKMSDPYRTLYMVDSPIPQIYQDALDRPEYWVLRFTYADGTVDNYKLDCGYQPVEPEFPPEIPDVPPCTENCNPPTTVPPTVTTTPPPTVTTPPTTACPDWICKGNVPPAPPPCVDMYGNVCTTQPGAGGNPGNGGAEDHGDDGYSPTDPPPTTIVPPAPPPSSIVTIPPTTAPPPPTTLVIPG